MVPRVGCGGRGRFRRERIGWGPLLEPRYEQQLDQMPVGAVELRLSFGVHFLLGWTNASIDVQSQRSGDSTQLLDEQLVEVLSSQMTSTTRMQEKSSPRRFLTLRGLFSIIFWCACGVHQIWNRNKRSCCVCFDAQFSVCVTVSLVLIFNSLMNIFALLTLL